jgi:hypothetical protein
MITNGSLPVRTRLPVAAWVLAGLVALFSLMQAIGATDHATPLGQQATAPAKGPYYASVTDLLGALGALTPRWIAIFVNPQRNT